SSDSWGPGAHHARRARDAREGGGGPRPPRARPSSLAAVRHLCRQGRPRRPRGVDCPWRPGAHRSAAALPRHRGARDGGHRPGHRASPPRRPRARARHDPARDHRPHDAGEPARGALARVHPDGGGEGTLADGRGPAPRALECAPPGAHGGRAPGRPAPRGRDSHRDDLFVAGHRAVGLRIDRGPRLRDRAGGEPLHRGDRRGREPGDGPALRARGSAYQVRLMATVAGAVRRAVASGDRGRTPTGEAWRRLVASPVARAGLVVVAAFVLIAVITPAVHDYDAKTDANLMARLTPPTAAHPFGTDTLGRDILVRLL